jgi:hypothetical protein
VKVALDGTEVDPSDISWLTSASIELPSAPATGVVVRIFRDTPVDDLLVEFSAGVLNVEDINQANLQLLYAIQEGLDAGADPEGLLLQAQATLAAALVAQASAADSATTAGLEADDASASAAAAQTSAAAAAGALAGKADKTTTVSAGTGLTGGGDLSANRSLAVDFASSAEVVAGVSSTKAVSPSTLKDAVVTRGHIFGVELSYTTTTTYTVSAGEAASEQSTTPTKLALASAMAKSLSAWAVGAGNGSLDTGSVANNTWYHVHLIRRDSDGLVDVLLSLSATAPTMPSGWTARRRLGSIRTNGSAQITQFFQYGDEFIWNTAVTDVSVQNPGTSAVLRTLTVPTGIKVLAQITASVSAGTTNAMVLLTCPDQTDTAPPAFVGGASVPAGPYSLSTPGNSNAWTVGRFSIRTNTSAQIRTRASASGASDGLQIFTTGWFDTRGAM